MQDIIDARYYDAEDGLWIELCVDKRPYAAIGPFETAGERDALLHRIGAVLLKAGCTEIPIKEQ